MNTKFQEWLKTYNGSIDVTAMEMAFKAGQRLERRKLEDLHTKIRANWTALQEARYGMTGERMAGYYDGQEAVLRSLNDDICEELDK